MSIEDLERFASDCLSALDEKKRDVIRRRYGLEGLPEETLEAIASNPVDGAVLTREAVRLRQNSALKVLSRSFSARADDLVSRNVDLLWKLADDGMMFRKKNLQDPMSGSYLLAWHVTTGTIRKFPEWLKRHAAEYAQCWIDRRISGLEKEVQRIGDAAPDIVRRLDKPWSLHAVAEQLDCSADRLRTLLTAAFPKLHLNTFCGYIFRVSSTARIRRAVMLHELMKHRVETAVTNIRELGTIYRLHTAGDACTDRDLLIVARDNKHLFLEIGSGYLAAVGSSAPDHEAAQTGATEHVSDAITEVGQESDEETNATRIANLLLTDGPQRLAAITQKLELIPGTVAGTLGQNFQFVRVLPGVYAVDTQVPSIDLAGCADALFNESEVLRVYIRARYAGEPFDLFPLWGWEFEHQLALWADRQRSVLLPELLWVSEPDQWPAPENVISHWLARKDREARYDIDQQPVPKLGKKLPEARHVLAALLLASDRGLSSVVSCNMIMAADGLDSSAGIPLLMLLVATGAVQSGDTWQSPHRCTGLADRWSARLGEDLANHGKLDWSSASAAAYLAAARARPGAEATWLDAEMLDALVTRLQPARSGSHAPALAPQREKAPQIPTLAPSRTPAESALDKDVAAEIVTTEQLRIAAHDRDPDATYQLALRTRIGNGTPENPIMANYWLRRAAELGHPAACVEVQKLPPVPVAATARREQSRSNAATGS